MDSNTFTRYLQLAGVPRNAIATTLQIEAQDVRKLIEADYLSCSANYIGYYVSPGSTGRITPEAINKTRLVYELMRKEILISGKVICDYPVFEAVKDAQRTERDDYYIPSLYPYGLGQRAVLRAINRAVPVDLPLSMRNYIFVPDFHVSAIQESGNFVSNFLQWMRLLSDAHDIKFILFSTDRMSMAGSKWGTLFSSYLNESFLEIPVKL